MNYLSSPLLPVTAPLDRHPAPQVQIKVPAPKAPTANSGPECVKGGDESCDPRHFAARWWPAPVGN